MALKYFNSEEKLQFLQVNLRVLCSKPICNNFQLGKKKKQSKNLQMTQKNPVQKYYFILPEQVIM